jgi:Mrp family chromosome partitioning ATPase
MDYLRIIFRRKSFVFAAVAIAVAAFFAHEAQKPHLYRAAAEVLLNDQSTASLIGLQPSGSGNDAERFAQTQAGVARSTNLARHALIAAGVRRAPEDFLRHSTVTAEPNQDILEFSVTDGSRLRAVRLANAYARQFPIYRSKLAVASFETAESQLRAQRQRAELASGSASPLYKSLSVRLDQLKTLAALQSGAAQVVTPAADATKVQPRAVRAIAIGLALGLLVGVALALIREATDTRIRDPLTIADALGVTLLARIPSRPESAKTEAFRVLSATLEFANLERRAKVIMVTGALRREGKSTTVLNLGLALAAAGKRVIIADFDLRKPDLAELVTAVNATPVTGAPGIVDVVLGKATIAKALSEVTPAMTGASTEPAEPPRRYGGSLRFIGSGITLPSAGHFIASPAFAAVLGELKQASDVVLVDSAPLLSVSDTIALTSHVDAILLVSRFNRARRQVLAEVRRVLDGVPTTRLGVAVTDVPLTEEYSSIPYGFDVHDEAARLGRRVAPRITTKN